MEHPENVPNCSLYQVPLTPQISWKSVQPFFRNVANRQRDRQTDRATDNDENITFPMAEVMMIEHFGSDQVLMCGANTINLIPSN